MLGISEEKQRKGKSNCVGKKVWRGKGSAETLRAGRHQTGQRHVIGPRARVPAEDRPLVFGVHGEPNGLLASPRGHGLRGDRLTGGRLSLAFVLIAVGAVGGRAVRRHQWSFPGHAHAPHARCRTQETVRTRDRSSTSDHHRGKILRGGC